MRPTESLLDRLSRRPPVLLDGATGTELSRRGVDTSSPQWSAAALLSAPHVVSQIHQDYIAAGAGLLTANTFRTHARNLATGGMEGRVRELTDLAVRIAREAANAADHPVWVAGSQAPIADCYSPELTPDDQALEAEHARMSEHLAAAGVDLILVETHPTLREALAATRAAVATGLPVIASVVCDEHARLLSGEPLELAAAELSRLPLAALSLNCLPAAGVEAGLECLRRVAPHVRRGAYANVGRMDSQQGWVQTPNADPAVYAAEAARWQRFDPCLIGGCCGTMPAHIHQLSLLLRTQSPG